MCVFDRLIVCAYVCVRVPLFESKCYRKNILLIVMQLRLAQIAAFILFILKEKLKNIPLSGVLQLLDQESNCSRFIKCYRIGSTNNLIPASSVVYDGDTWKYQLMVRGCAQSGF